MSSKKKNQLKVQLVPTESLAPYQDNPRHIREENYDKLKKSLEEFPSMLDVRPLVAREDGTVLGGNMRLRAAQELGIEQLPVVFVDWDEDKQREFVIKDNANFGEWDWEKLANEWTDLPLTDWSLPVWNLEQAKTIETVNDLDNDEWVGMPEFETASESFKIIIHFESEADRDEYVAEHEMQFNHKTTGAWSTWHPYRPQRDRNAFEYQ